MLSSKVAELRDRLARRYGLRVLSGPFAGMRYVGDAVGSELLPKLLGSYERELHGFFARMLEEPRTRVMNIGSGEGYYAVGLARRWPNAHVYAFEKDAGARRLCQELARLNGVAERVTVAGECHPEHLRDLVSGDSLVVCDCEGDEVDLLDPNLVPELQECELLVEFHDCFNPLISPTVAGRFTDSHSIERATSEPRDPDLFMEIIRSMDRSELRPDGEEWLSGWSDAERRLALDENRPVGMPWARLVPRPVAQRAAAGCPRAIRAGDSAGRNGAERPELAISACILAYNEESRIEAAIQCLQGWTDQIIVIDNESTDRTAEIARCYTEHVLTAPRLVNFDALRNLAIEAATGGWIYYLDADERVPARLGEMLRRLVRERGEDFEAFYIPFRHYFCGKWIQHSGWWPGYKAPQLLKKGHFQYGERVHSGVQVSGRSCFLPADDLDLTVAHYTYDDLSHYLTKINGYTDAEAQNLRADGALHCWQAQLAHFVHDWQTYYERGEGYKDGMHGFVLAFMAGTYRFLSRAKLWLLRSQHGELNGPEAVPSSTREMFAFMARVAQEGPEPWLAANVYPVRAAAERTIGWVPAEWCKSPPDAALARTGEVRAGGGITGCILARNEERRIEGALRSLGGWTDEIIVIDNGSQDRTAEIAARYADRILSASPAANFDGLRNLAIEAASGAWIFFLDADERVSPGLGRSLRELVREHGDAFDAVCVPFRNHFYGRWMQSPMWWPGYKGPQLLRKGTFRYGEVVHAGAQVDGRLLYYPGDDPAFSVDHYAYEDIAAYLSKLNRYTDAEAEFRDAAGAEHSWSSQLAQFAHELQVHYDHGQAYRDGMHGFVQSFLCAFYRFATQAKIWDRRRQRGPTPRTSGGVGTLAEDREPVPSSLGEMLELMIRVVSAPVAPQKPAIAPPPSAFGPGAIPSQHDAIVLQCASGDHVPLMELSRERHETYARAHGMDYLCRFGPQQTERHPCWDKIPIILEVLRSGKHQQIFWLDADTLIVDPEPDFRGVLPPECWLGMVHHGDPPYFNNGVMYIRNTPQALAFFEEIWRNWPLDDRWFDNETLNWLLQQDPARWPGICILDDKWNSTALENECRRPVVRAWHGYAKPAHRHAAMAACLQRVLSREQHSRAERADRHPPATRVPAPAGAPGEPAPSVLMPTRPNCNLVPRDPPVAVDFERSLGRALRVQWEGDQFVRSSLALVNREFCLGLLAAGDVELAVAERPAPWYSLARVAEARFEALEARLGAELSGPPDVTIRHHFPPDWHRPETGKLIVMQPWELSHLPAKSWIEGATRGADEVWAYSRFVRDVYVRSGVPAEKVRVVPLGFNPEIFTAEGRRFALPTQKGFRFLFVGGALERKGADLLLAAYRRAFAADDDVCLIVKDMGTRTFYRGQTLGEAFRQAAADPRGPEVIYLEDDLADTDLASLYRACTCVVLPYRGEGFALPPLEGMACGRPSIVTAGGPTDDYLDDTMALRVPQRRRLLRGLYTGPDACEWDPWNFEPDLDGLVDALRWARDHPEQTRQRGEAARAYVHGRWTWERAVALGRERLLAVAAPDSPQETAPAKPWVAPAGVAGGKGRAKKAGSGGVRSGARTARAGRAVELSFCMIARDEEPRIAHCLESIAPYVDEMIVVDTESRDGTREEAHRCGARVYEFPWTDSFAAARNQSLAQARGAWVFWMDADDVIAPECGEKLRELIRQCPERNAAYQVVVRIPPGPREFSASIVDHVKLFPNRPDLRFEHRIHEQILPAIRQAGLEIRFSDVYVTHQHYDRSAEGQAKKRQRDFRLLEMDLRDNPDHPFILFNLGMTHLFATRECEVAAQYLQRCLERSHPTDSIVRKAYALLTTARTWLQETGAAIAVNEAGRQHYPDDAELLFQAGQLYQAARRPAEARLALERLLGGEDAPHYRSVDPGLRTYRGRHELALLYRRSGDERRCEQLLGQVAAVHPEYVPARLDWVRSLHSLGEVERARRVLGEIVPAAVIEGELRELGALLEGPRDRGTR